MLHDDNNKLPTLCSIAIVNTFNLTFQQQAKQVKRCISAAQMEAPLANTTSASWPTMTT